MGSKSANNGSGASDTLSKIIAGGIAAIIVIAVLGAIVAAATPLTLLQAWLIGLVLGGVIALASTKPWRSLPKRQRQPRNTVPTHQQMQGDTIPIPIPVQEPKSSRKRSKSPKSAAKQAKQGQKKAKKAKSAGAQRPPEYVPREQPDKYEHLRLWPDFVIEAIQKSWIMFLVCTAIAVSTFMPNAPSSRGQIFVIFCLIAIGFPSFMLAREHGLWEIHPIKADAESGELILVEADSRKWFYNGSSDDSWDLTSLTLTTPRRNLLEYLLYFFKIADTNTIILSQPDATKPNGVKIRKVRFVVDVPHIERIRKYVLSQQVENTKATTALYHETRETNQKLDQLINLQRSAQYKQAVAPPDDSQSQPPKNDKFK